MNILGQTMWADAGIYTSQSALFFWNLRELEELF
jgi:hypothetical protein